MRRIAWLATVLICSTFVSFVQAEENDRQSSASAADASRIAREEEKRVLEALSRRNTFECQGLPLNEAIFKLSQLIDCEILFDAVSLVEEGISMDQNVTLKLGELTGWQTLHFLLNSLHLTWVANDGVLEITTEGKAADVFVTRVYDVHQLCKTLEPLTREMLFRQAKGKPQPGRMGGGFFSVPPTAVSTAIFGQFGGMGGGAGAANPGPLAVKSVEAVLAGMIVNCTSLQWLDRNGDGGTVQLGQGCLIISQTYQGQFEIAGLLQALERLVEGNFRGKSIAARRIGYPNDDDAKIFETLAKPKTVVIEEGSLEQVLGQIARDSDLRIWIDHTAQNDEGINLGQPVSPRRKMQKLPLAICLKKILEPYLLECVVDEGVLVFTTRTRAAEMTTIRIYDIGGISKIANDVAGSGVVSVLSRSTHGRWLEDDSEGGAASLISSKHLVVRQTQQVHTEIALLIDDLTKEELIVPVDPPLELRVYTATDADTARDLERVLPQLMETRWNLRGSIRQAGASLFINQPAAVHDRLDEIMEKLEQSHLRRNPPPKEPVETKPQGNPEEHK